ncbi:MAG TPA: ATP-binding protein [Pyrinomonadaceae bacterium]|nr:ATP-binding protein [Pyrinomonadaceae bacterium]
MSIDLVVDRETQMPGPVDPKVIGCHTAVLAQSGSGKSFMVGRLVEEILLKAKARVIILDPNSDFVRLGDIDPKPWTKPALTPWFFPGETAGAFASQWSRVQTVILSNRNLPKARPLRINWGALSDGERADVMGIDRNRQPELYWSLVLAGEVARSRWTEGIESDYDFEHFRAVADELCDYLLGTEVPDISQHSLATNLRTLGPITPLRFRELVYALETFEIWRSVGDGDQDISDIVGLRADSSSVVVVDLLSVETEPERVALTTRTLAALWKAAREGYSGALRDIEDEDQRVPTILVIDEAHNIVPTSRSSSAAERLAADIVRIAAEGRKFGLFLLVVTQRPRKLDLSVLSECDGLFLMKMTNSSDLKYAAETFGFLPAEAVEGAKKLKVGEVFLLGRLGGTSTVWHVAPRRTMEGGRSLDESYWTTPYPDPP